MMREFLEGAAIFLEEPLLASMPVESWKVPDEDADVSTESWEVQYAAQLSSACACTAARRGRQQSTEHIDCGRQ